jgi:tetratricopeptide (TPR) repeat protein
MLTGRPPFKGETPMETVRQVTDDDPVPPSRLVPRTARDLETICLKCLHKEPHRRYDSARALADDLERFLSGRPIHARRTPLWERGLKWARRRPAAATFLCLALVFFLSLPAGFAVHEHNLRLQEAHASQWRDERQNTGNRLIGEAREATTQEAITQKREGLVAFRASIKDEPRLAWLLGDVDKTIAQLRERLQELWSREAEQARQRTDLARHQDFLRKRDQAFLHETRFTGLDLLSNQGETRRWAKAALAVFAAPGPGDSWTLGPLPAILSPQEKDEVKEGCYELLLVLAEAVDEPGQGLRFLDQAARLLPATHAYHLRRAACLARRGDAAGAERERQRAERLPAATAFDHFLAGEERYRRREWSTAIGHFDAALQLQPDHFWSHCLAAIGCVNLGQFREAKVRLNACLRREPRFAWLYVLRGFASTRIAASIRDAAEKQKHEVSSSRLRADADLQFQAAEKDFRLATELLQSEPNQELRYALLVNHGLLGLERRDWDQAKARLLAAIQLNGRQWEAFTALAEVYQRRGQPDEAIAQYGRAIDLKPDWSALYRGRADAELARQDPTPGQRAQALRDLDQAIRLEDPGNPVLARDHGKRAVLLLRDHRDEEALAACDAALKAFPDHIEAHRLRLDLLRKGKRHAEVIRCCDDLLARQKPSAELYELRGLAKEALGDHAGAIADVTQAITLSPQSAPLLARRGELYLITDAPRSALRDFEETLRLDPNSADACIGRGLARAALGQHQLAAADAAQALRLGEPTPRRFYNAARIYAKAAIAAATEVRKRGQDAVSLVARYQDQAVALIREAIKRHPAPQRASFVTNVVRADPALATLRHRLRSLELAGQ